MTMPTNENYPAEFALVIVNEYSSGANRMRKEIAGLTIAHKIIPTSLESDKMFDDITNSLPDGAVIVSAGGDGTTNLVGNVLLSPEGREASLHQVPFAPLRGGNANDIAIMINGRSSANAIVRRGKPTTLKPLEVSINGNEPRFAFGYFSIGGTAEASRQLQNMKELELSGAQKRIREALTALVATADYPAFNYHTYKEDAIESVTDIMCIRGNRIAKYGRPKARLNEEQFAFLIDKSEGRLDAAIKLGRMGLHALWGSSKEHVYMTVASPGPERATLPVQYDGEASTIPSGSNVGVSVSRHSYTALTTQL